MKKLTRKKSFLLVGTSNTKKHLMIKKFKHKVRKINMFSKKTEDILII